MNDPKTTSDLLDHPKPFSVLRPIFPTDRDARRLGIEAPTAEARALVALRMLASPDPWTDGYERSFDNCFEMNDGDEVVRAILALLDAQPTLERLFRTGAYLTSDTLTAWREWSAANPPDQLALAL